MSSGISYPASLPYVQAAGHTREPEPVAERVDMEYGPARLRRRYTTAPAFAEISTWLNQAEFDAFHDFFEDVLQSGARSFNIAMAGLESGGIEWWEARFAGPWKAPYRNGGRYLVTARLRLLTPLGATRPAPGGLAAEGAIRLAGDAALHVDKTLHAEFALALSGDATLSGVPRLLAAEGAITLSGDATMPTTAAAYLRQDGGYILRQDGGRILRES